MPTLVENITSLVGAIGSDIKSLFTTKQDNLVSGSNIKTINGQTLLGSGDLVVGAGITASRAVMTGPLASTSIALADVPELVLPVLAGAVYLIECTVTFRSASNTTGLGLGLTSPAGSTNRVEIEVPITSTAAASQLRTIFPNAASASNVSSVLGTGVTATNSDHTARISGLIVVGGNGGNVQIRFATEISGSAITLQAGSSLVLVRVA